MEVKKIKKMHTHYEPDFKEEILRMRVAAQMNSDKMLIRYRRRLGLVEMSSPDARYTWKSKSQMKTKTKTLEEQTTYSLNRNADRLILENEQLKKRTFDYSLNETS